MSLRNHSAAAIQRARKLRATMSESERRLWARLRGQALGVRFRRQFPAGPYTLDFYCHDARLCVEVDGDLHSERQEKDAYRDAWLIERGVLTLRVTTAEVYDNLEGILQAIYDLCRERAGPYPPDS